VNADYLNTVGRRTVKAVNVALAHDTLLRKQWNSSDAERARSELCKVLAISDDNRFWADLEDAIPKEFDQAFVEQIKSLDLDKFEDFEVQMLRAAGAEPEVAAEWAGTTVLLLSTIRRGLVDQLPSALIPDAGWARESVQLAHQALCERRPGLVPPGNKTTSRKKLWGGIFAVSGLGTMSLNGAALLGAPLTGGMSGLFGAGSLLGGFAQLLGGAERLHRAASEKD
jgi:hypothetical protein